MIRTFVKNVGLEVRINTIRIDLRVGRERMNDKHIPICYECKNAKYDFNLSFYDIRCKIDGKVYDENYGCKDFDYDAFYARVNPRL